MSQIIYDNKLIFKKAAKKIKKSIEELLTEKDIITIGLPGGRSIVSILNELKSEMIDWDKIHIFMVDERHVSIDDKDSNFRLINESLSDVISKKNLHPFIYQKDNYLKKYETEIKKFNGLYDIIILSSGEDGHIASLFPNHSSILDESEYYINIEDSPKLPKKRMSVSKRFLQKSKIGFLFFIGKEKNLALKKFKNEKINFINCPAKLISKLPCYYVFTDIMN